MRTVLKIICSIGVVCAGPLAMAQAEDTWKVLLEQQLLVDEKCELNYLTDLSTSENTAGLEVKARAHCQDSRSFDVHKQPAAIKFEISSCKPTYC
ncbi:unnamed protein product [Discosporangium mesarthrocarpum]